LINLGQQSLVNELGLPTTLF